MNILRNPKNRICSIFSVDQSSEEFEKMLFDTSRESDIYLILSKNFSKSSNVNSYCHLLPVSGYIVDDRNIVNRTDPLINVLEYLVYVVKYYSMFYIGVSLDSDISKIRKIYESRLESSVMKSDLISYDIRKSIYSLFNVGILKRLFPSNKGINITHQSSDILLNLPTVLSIIESIKGDEEYYDTFKDVEFSYSIPSILEKYEIHYMNSEINKVNL